MAKSPVTPKASKSNEEVDYRSSFNEGFKMQPGMKFGIFALIILVVGTILSFTLIKVKVVGGSQMGVKETMDGVFPDALPPKTYVLFPGFFQDIYLYDMTTQNFVMNDTPGSAGESGHGREHDPYLVQSQDQQDMHINLSVRWKFDPEKIVKIHKNYHAYVGNSDNSIIEERLLRNTVQLIVKNHATKMKAVAAYSGDDLVKLQQDIEKDLADPNSDLRNQGIIVENFVIEKITLDPKYTDEIKARQIAQQKQLRAVEETKAAEADALRVKAVAQADLNKAVVEAQRDKEVAILKSEQEGQSKVIAAKAAADQVKIEVEANANKVRTAALAEKDAAIAQASAIQALGQAEGAAATARYSAYASPGAETFARIEISKNMALAFGNIKGYLPSDMHIGLLSSDFMKSIDGLMSGNNHQPTPANK